MSSDASSVNFVHLSFASPWVDPRGTHGNGTVLVLLFPRRGGEFFSFGNDFAGPLALTHGICSRQRDRQSEECFTWYHVRCVKMSKKWGKKIHFFCYFCQ